MLISSYIAVMVMTNSADKRQLSICLGHGKLTLGGELCRDVNAACNAWLPSWLCLSCLEIVLAIMHNTRSDMQAKSLLCLAVLNYSQYY